jgi:hypothetical protein
MSIIVAGVDKVFGWFEFCTNDVFNPSSRLFSCDTMEAEVNAESKNPTKVEVNVRGYSFEIDESEEQGGPASAPNPVEYEIGALTGCFNVVAHLVADEMGWNWKIWR